VCCQEENHQPSCTKCAEGFALIIDIQANVKETIGSIKALANDETSNNKNGRATDNGQDSLPEEAKVEEAMADNNEPANIENNCVGSATGESKQDPLRKKQKHQEHAGEGKGDYATMSSKELVAVLKDRNLPASGPKVKLLERLQKSDVDIEARKKRNAEYKGLNFLQRDQLSEAFDFMTERMKDLREYRSHVARHVAEASFAAKELEDLLDNEAVVTSDYKMKILSCYFREAQSKWFGKSGTSALGFMIVSNPTDEDAKAKQMKDVSFVILFTNDTFQDEWGICTAKTYVFQECLPQHIDTVFFVSDGAGNFKAKLHKGIMPFWKLWTGITERRNRVTPAGDGKTSLDGIFGQLMFLLRGACDAGGSYYDGTTIMDTVESTKGLKATAFRQYTPDRSNQVKIDLKAATRFDSILSAVLGRSDRVVTLYKHSGYGEGVQLALDESMDFFWDPERSKMCTPGNKKTKPRELKTGKKATTTTVKAPTKNDLQKKKADDNKEKKEDPRYWVGSPYNHDVSKLCFVSI
jgi:hypothetical protein